MALSRQRTAPRWQILIAFTSVYLFWGATYAASRIGVHFVPAPLLAGVRLAVGGCLMLTFCAARGKRILGSAQEMRRLLLLGVLLLFGGNLGLVWAEYYIPSGFAALLVAIVPIYVAIIEWILPTGERLRLRGQAGLVLGFLGLGVLLWPSLQHGLRGDARQVLAVVALLLGALSFACGSVLARRSSLALHPLVCAGWEMLVASACDLSLSTVLHQERIAHWNRESVVAVGYLVLFGSLAGFSAYVWLLSHVPVAKVATYAYVNPAVAVLIGALLLGERLQANEYAGMAITLLAVFLVTSSQMRSGRPVAELECAAVEFEA
jgi:drug/metabolite transporter (DMT)-like permease